MRPRPADEARAAAVRLRAAAPLLAFTAPAALLVVAGVVSAAEGDDAALGWVAAAAPVTAVLAAVRDDRSLGLLALLVSGIASAPLWSLLGIVLGRRARSFVAFWRWYGMCAVAWAAVALVLVP